MPLRSTYAGADFGAPVNARCVALGPSAVLARGLLLWCLSCGGIPAPAESQSLAPPAYDSAVTLLSQGDTVQALSVLRAATRSAPRFGPAFLRLGSVLSARASTIPSQFQERLEAERALQRAANLLGDDPEVLLEQGLLLWKQGERVSARRVLDHAWSAADRKSTGLPESDQARLHYVLARIYETWWEDWQDLVALPPEATGGLRCSRVLEPVQGPDPAVAATLAVYCPEAWARIVKAATPLADLKAEERERMIGHYRRAFDLDSSLTDAGVRLLGHLADDGEWEVYDYFSRRLVRSSPVDARTWLFLGLGLHERGRDADADSAFARALVLLPPVDRRVFGDIAPLIPRAARATYAALDSGTRARTAAAFLEAEDPLYLTSANERRLEHYARLAWAELKFGMPELGHRGWDTDRGNIWVRYGAPASAVMCCYGGAESGLDARFVFWSYGPSGPVFTFRKPLVYRSARLTESAQLVADALDATTPEAYRPRTVPAFFPLPYQIVRFRGTTPELTRVEIYAAAPLDSLEASPGDSIAMGIFVFDAAYKPIWSRRHDVVGWGEPIQVNYAFQVPGGVFHYGIEARRYAPDSVPRPADRSRDSVVIGAGWSGGLAMSDLLVADSIAALVSTPLGRDNFAIEPSRTLVFASGRAVHLYFELYGLAGDSAGVGHYRVELAVEDSAHANVVQRVLRGVVDLFRRSGGQLGPASIAWDREVPAGRDRSPDYVAVQLPELSPGAYVIRLHVTDKATGQTAATSRVFHVAAARKAP